MHAFEGILAPVTGIVELIVAILLAIAFAWLCLRAWRVKSTAVRIVAGVVTALLTLVVAAVSVVGLIGVYRLYAPHGSRGLTLARPTRTMSCAPSTRTSKA